ncbi:PVC-type heme-binding CxxCH protein [Dyadobacter sp.]|uniref:PVC-type heme-binding CxxCH protein n=1 Tax=Dyadobacter sp. TaxID=1914288 RepID=UPI003F7242CA
MASLRLIFTLSISEPVNSKRPKKKGRALFCRPDLRSPFFASEPDITKPINMEFDDRGRLWVTQSSEYPVAAGQGDGKDRIMILEDKNGDGKADTFTHFEDNLNIPIGIMPVADGAIAYSLPNLYYFKDDNDDGRADSKKVLLGPFGHKDTHGMVNNLMRGYDGWLHVCHGFSNTSHVAGTDGDTIKMTSGNTFRVKLDGSRVEQTTFGRVNPFGYAYDEKGFLYSVDCHTKPITQLIFGGDYPHFGKKAPAGLGFAPVMMDYDLGSTALAGLVYYTGTQFPEQYRNRFYTGDVVTCRIDRNTITFKGSTPVSKKEDPLLVSKDPWFRPVDVKLGPDGALYIADFYNRIIGHYEVALNHPGRDRLSGRIWKITYKGDLPHENMAVTDWSKATLDQLIEGLKHPQLNTRLKVADRIVDTFGQKAIRNLKASIPGNENAASRVHAMWALHRLGALDYSILSDALTHHYSTVKLHAFRILLEGNGLNERFQVSTLNALRNEDPNVRRVAAEILGKFRNQENFSPLMDLYAKADPGDTHLKYTTLLAIRNNLKDNHVVWRIPGMKWTDQQAELLAKAMLDVPSSAEAAFVLDYTLTHELNSADLVKNLEYIGRYVTPYQLEKAIDLIKLKFADNPETQLSLYKTIKAGVKQSGMEPGEKMVVWGTDLASRFLGGISESSHNNPNGKSGAPENSAKAPEVISEQRVAAAEIAGKFRLKALEPQLQKSLKAKWLDYPVRAAAANALMNIDPKANVNVLAEVFTNPTELPVLREKLAASIGQVPSASNYEMLKKQLASGAQNLQVAIAAVLASTSQGIDYLLNAFKDEEVSPAIGNEIAVKERFEMNANANQRHKMEKYLAAGADEREERQKLINNRIANFKPTTSLTDAGKSVFVQNCSGCHQILGQGGLVGPQLDGIGNWGHKALTQKILDSNRNITEAFRTYNITLKNDQTLTGLYRRTEGETMVFADMTGKEFVVAKNEIKEYRASKYTLMPDQFKSIIPEKDFYELMDYLLSVK